MSREIASFEVRVPRAVLTGAPLSALRAVLEREGEAPLRWAIVAVEGDELVIAGVRLCSR